MPLIAGSSPRARASVTSVDVARRAGVSQTTVSLVLSGKAAELLQHEDLRKAYLGR